MGKFEVQNLPVQSMLGFNPSIVDAADAVNDVRNDQHLLFGYTSNVI